jgi:hypothetical protein
MGILIDQLEALIRERIVLPPGPCLICGVPGAKAEHRTIDAIKSRVAAGEPLEEVLADYEE